MTILDSKLAFADVDCYMVTVMIFYIPSQKLTANCVLFDALKAMLSPTFALQARLRTAIFCLSVVQIQLQNFRTQNQSIARTKFRHHTSMCHEAQ